MMQRSERLHAWYCVQLVLAANNDDQQHLTISDSRAPNDGTLRLLTLFFIKI